jgi:sugar O-acyltransferase (sialic acid O-acetyltransferase NeuD family)
VTTRPLVIFGVGELGQLAHYYFTHDSPRTIAGFAVDADYAKTESIDGLPVVAFDSITERFPPTTHDVFVAIGYTGLNHARAEKCARLKVLGYALASYVSSRASVWPDLVAGENCFIMEGNVIQPFVRIGNNVIIWANSLISHHVEIGDNCFIASEVTVSGHVRIEDHCFIGVNATLRERVNIGRNCIVGAGALILKDARPDTAYMASETKDSGIPSRRLQSLL